MNNQVDVIVYDRTPNLIERRESSIALVFFALGSSAAGIALTYSALNDYEPGETEFAVFLGVTLILFSAGLISYAFRVRSLKNAHDRLCEQNPEDVCLRDYPWDPAKAEVSFKEKGHRRFRMALALGSGPLVFHYLIFRYADFFIAETFLLLFFDAIALAVFLSGVLAVYQHQHYGLSEFRFNLYPYFLGECVEGRWWTEKPLKDTGELEISLLCMQSRTETDEYDQSKRVTSILYSQKYVVREIVKLDSNQELPVSLPLPKPDNLETHLNCQNPRHWELRIKMIGAKIPYEVSFLLPVYRRNPATTS